MASAPSPRLWRSWSSSLPPADLSATCSASLPSPAKSAGCNGSDDERAVERATKHAVEHAIEYGLATEPPGPAAVAAGRVDLSLSAALRVLLQPGGLCATQ